MKLLSKLTVVAVVVVLAMSFSSCEKDCYVCTDANGNSEEFCEEELGKTATDLAVAFEEGLGSTCERK